MSIIQAIIYGIVQGIGEFLPISSSGHLIALPQVADFLGLGWKDPGLAFDVALHLGTLFAVILFFWKDWITLTKAGVKGVKTTEGKMFWFLVIATIPGALIGKLLEKNAEESFRNLGLIGAALIIMGIILYFADRYGRKKIHLEQIGFMQSLLIGFSQALAIIPGVSRAGATMSTALYLGLTKEAAARFSFLLSTPIILGAGILKFKEILRPGIPMQFLLIGVVVSAITGFFSIKFLLDYLKNKGFGIFVIYRFIVGIAFISIYFMSR